MTLRSNVEDRVSEQLLIEITNHGITGAAAINDTRLDAAVDDAIAEMLIETGLVYDDTDKVHVALAVDGVLHYLHIRTAQTGRNVTDIRDRWERGLIKLAMTRGGERRLLPSTDSVLEHSTEVSGRRPDQDRSRWDGFVPRAPSLDEDADL